MQSVYCDKILYFTWKHIFNKNYLKDTILGVCYEKGENLNHSWSSHSEWTVLAFRGTSFQSFYYRIDMVKWGFSFLHNISWTYLNRYVIEYSPVTLYLENKHFFLNHMGFSTSSYGFLTSSLYVVGYLDISSIL